MENPPKSASSSNKDRVHIYNHNTTGMSDDEGGGFESFLCRLSDILFLLDVILCLISLILGPIYLVQCDENRSVSIYLLLHGLSYFLLATAFAIIVAGLLACGNTSPDSALVGCQAAALTFALIWPVIGLGLILPALSRKEVLNLLNQRLNRIC